MHILRRHCILGGVRERTSCGIVWSTLEIAHDNKLFCGQPGGGRYLGGRYLYPDLDLNVTLLIWRRHVTAGLLRSRPLCRHLFNSASGHDQLGALLCCGLPNSASKHIRQCVLRISYICVDYSSGSLWICTEA